VGKRVIKLRDIVPSLVVEDFGRIAFGDTTQIVVDRNRIRNLIKMQRATRGEPNTKEEEELLDIIWHWLYYADTKSANFLYKSQDVIRRNMDKYPAIFKPSTPNGTVLYRGLRHLQPNLVHELTELIRLNELHPVEIIRTGVGDNKFFRIKKKIRVSHRYPVQSWTFDSRVTSRFLNPGFPVILRTTQTNEFLFNHEFFNTLYHTPEGEILHFGNSYSKPVELLVGESFVRKVLGQEYDQPEDDTY